MTRVLTKDGVEFKLGMTLYQTEDSCDGIMIHTMKTNDQDHVVDEREPCSVVWKSSDSSASWTGWLISESYANWQKAVEELIPSIDETIRQLQEKRAEFLRGEF